MWTAIIECIFVELNAEDQKTLKKTLIHRFKEVGFTGVGFAKAGKLQDEENHFTEWLQRGYQGTMAYLERNVDKRLDPTLLFEGCQSVIVLLHPYIHAQTISPDSVRHKVARYAQGEDYHRVLKDKIYPIAQASLSLPFRVFTDSAPIHERTWAMRAGLGWIGKNSLLLHRGMGSYFFIAIILTQDFIPPDTPFETQHCGTCTACIDACPTDAIVEAGVVNGSKCISYGTIEWKGVEKAPQLENTSQWAFGCDICQEVCPWNRFSLLTPENRFSPLDKTLKLMQGASLSEEEWTELSISPIHRAGKAGWERNISGSGA